MHVVTEPRAPGRAGWDFDDLYAAQFRGITVQLYAYFGNLSEAEEVTQEAFCRAWDRWDTVRRYDDPVAWVRRVAWRLAISRWRRVKTMVAYARRQREQHEPPLDGLRVDLVRALTTLGPDDRRFMVQHYLGGMPVAEIAELAGLSPNTVKSRMRRAREAMRPLLALTDADPEEVV